MCPPVRWDLFGWSIGAVLAVCCSWHNQFLLYQWGAGLDHSAL